MEKPCSAQEALEQVRRCLAIDARATLGLGARRQAAEMLSRLTDHEVEVLREFLCGNPSK